MSFQRLKCIEVSNSLSATESKPIAACKKKFDQKMLDHMKCVSSIAYNTSIAEHNKPYTDIAGLLALVYKLGAEVRSEYNNDMRCADLYHILLKC
jgi:hypothetical protein